jgi:hypothetical protein
MLEYRVPPGDDFDIARPIRSHEYNGASLLFFNKNSMAVMSVFSHEVVICNLCSINI